jgi:hypothetical protein
MFPHCLGDVFFKATAFARQAGATASGGYAFSIKNRDWTPVSIHAAAT